MYETLPWATGGIRKTKSNKKPTTRTLLPMPAWPEKEPICRKRMAIANIGSRYDLRNYYDDGHYLNKPPTPWRSTSLSVKPSESEKEILERQKGKLKQLYRKAKKSEKKTDALESKDEDEFDVVKWARTYDPAMKAAQDAGFKNAPEDRYDEDPELPEWLSRAKDIVIQQLEKAKKLSPEVLEERLKATEEALKKEQIKVVKKIKAGNETKAIKNTKAETAPLTSEEMAELIAQIPGAFPLVDLPPDSTLHLTPEQLNMDSIDIAKRLRILKPLLSPVVYLILFVTLIQGVAADSFREDYSDYMDQDAYDAYMEGLYNSLMVSSTPIDVPMPNPFTVFFYIFVLLSVVAFLFLGVRALIAFCIRSLFAEFNNPESRVYVRNLVSATSCLCTQLQHCILGGFTSVISTVYGILQAIVDFCYEQCGLWLNVQSLRVLLRIVRIASRLARRLAYISSTVYQYIFLSAWEWFGPPAWLCYAEYLLNSAYSHRLWLRWYSRTFWLCVALVAVAFDLAGFWSGWDWDRGSFGDGVIVRGPSTNQKIVHFQLM